MDTLIQALQASARTGKGVHLPGRDDPDRVLSYRQLQDDALALLGSLNRSGVAAGDQVILQYADLGEMMTGFWACLLGGIVPVPLALADQAGHADKVMAVWRVLDRPWLAHDGDKTLERLANFAAKTGLDEQWQAMQSGLLTPDREGPPGTVAQVGIDDTAFIQFSSGSTGTPKGVMLTHGNLLANIQDILASIHHRDDDVYLSWKPITHDFGMIAFHLTPVVAGCDQVRIPTDAFIWNPSLWLTAAHRYRATILGSPNFGYRHFLKLYRRGKRQDFGWDLSCVRVILNGAEPISADLCEEFHRELLDYGLPPRAMTPGYGLAEGSLIVSLCPPGEKLHTLTLDRRHLSVGQPLTRPERPDHGLDFVDCGLPYPHTQVRITDQRRQPLGEDRIGQIEIRGPSVTAGYYRNPEATARVVDGEGWLNTEDLGLLHRGRLYVVGRVKEMIVIGGVNYFPHDIERVILRSRGEDNLNHYIACGVADPDQGSEQLLIFVYHKGSLEGFGELAEQIRQAVSEQLGLPVAHVIPVRRIPKTTSGKVQRFKLVADFLAGDFDPALEELGEDRTLGSGPQSRPVNPQGVAAGVARRVAALLGRPAADLDHGAGFFDLGLTSLKLLTLRQQLEEDFGVLLDSSSPLDFPNVVALAREIQRLLGEDSAPRPQADAAPTGREDVAVIGMACRFPGGVDSPRAYWELLAEGRDPVTELPGERWNQDPNRDGALTTRQGGYLTRVDQFDPLFFGIAPAEAQSLDPQQRLLLEVCHEALENAGQLPGEPEGCRTGVFVGISGSDYAQVGRQLGHDTGAYTFTGTMFNTAAGRISYTFGFRGPCLAVDTACSSSLVAIQQGIRELRAGSCDRVLAGGVSLMLASDGHLSFSHLNALSPSGRCRSFDGAADGYIRSEGCGVVVLKRLSRALEDGDPILGVIRGAAVNHNGRSGGLTVPSGQAQERLIRAALDEAALTPDQVDYLEAHGSGTRLGDPQELNALARVFAHRSRPLWLGSVKSNLGHLESAAGVAGLIKVLLTLGRGTLVPNLHFTTPNPLFDWQRLPLRVVDACRPWETEAGRPRIAGISSFGISGTNAHLVLQEPPRPESLTRGEEDRPGPFVFTLSARSPEGLQATAQAFLDTDHWHQAPLAALCQSVNRLRSRLPVRFACNVDKPEGLIKRLTRLAQKGPAPARSPGKVAFLFTGQGSHYPGMARELYRDSRIFREAFHRCAEGFKPLLELDLAEALYGEPARELDSPRLTQALIFTVEYALSELWQSLGVKPELVLGHSIGEYAAACRAGVMTLEAALTMVALRGRLMEEAPADGAVAGILADQATVESLCQGEDVHLAAFNGPDNITVSGEREAVARVVAAARKGRVFTEALPMQHAFHSPRMAPTADRLARELADLDFAGPTIPLISTQTGQPVERADQMDGHYWSRHLCQPVRFAQAMKTAADQGATVFVEIGATATLSGLGAQLLRDEQYLFLPSLRQGRDAWAQFNDSLATLWQGGQAIDWDAYHDGRYRFVPDLPNTGYHRSPCWFDDRRTTPNPHREVSSMTVSPPAVAVPAGPDQAQVLTDIKEMVSRVTGVAPSGIDDQVHLFALGVDSLMLVQLDRQVVARYGVDIPLKTFFAELHTPAKIAAHVFANMDKSAPAPVEAPPAPAAAVPVPAVTAPLPPGTAAPADGVAAIVHSQLEIMRQQLALLGGSPAQPVAAALSQPAAPVPARPEPRPVPPAPESAKVNRMRDMTLQEEDIDDRQRAFVADLVERFNRRTPKSKAYAQQHRAGFADWIATLNFSLTTKEWAYPLVAESSRGSRFRDIDGNDYIDTAIGYGVSFFGHNPAFITQAIQEQLQEGMELGPQTDLAGEVTQLIRELTGVERVAFCNTGTEAVMVAVRLARTVTRRRRIVRFITSFHGSFDGVLAEAGEGGDPVPMAPGIPPGMVEDTVVLHYGSPESLETIRALGPELAAVLVEPVQSRNPGLQPREYLQELRRITERSGTALVFDEMVTGFRIHTGGAQAHFGVRADLVTYGKIVGGGMPIGIVGGAARFLDAIDGGSWDFGDASGPFQETTFFAGTFCKHPLTLAASRAVLRRLRDEGAELIQAANEMTRRFVDRANAFFATEAVPLRAACFGSMYRFETRPSQDLPRLSLETNLLFRLMMLDGVYVWERRTCFFSTAHSEADADAIFQALKKAVARLRQGGFSFRALGAPPADDLPVPVSYPLSSEERRVYVLSRMEGGELAYHVTGALELTGPLDTTRLENAFRELTRRHPALRTAYALEDGDIRHRVLDEVAVELHRDSDRDRPLEARLLGAVRPFSPDQAPLWRLTLLERGPADQVLVLDFHHLISDGTSLSILLQEFLALYQGQELPPARGGYDRYVTWEREFIAGQEAQRQGDYWRQVLTPLPTPLNLPLDFPRPPRNDFAGEAVSFTLPEATLPGVRDLAREQQVTPFMVLLGAYLAFLHRLSGQDDLCVGTPFDRRASGPFEDTVGMFAQTLVIRTRAEGELTFAGLLERVRQACTGAYGNPDYPLDRLLEELAVPRDFGRNPLFDTLFIYESGNRRVFDIPGLKAATLPMPVVGAPFDLTLELTEERDRLKGSLIFARRLLSRDTVRRWADYFGHLLQQVLTDPNRPLGELELLTPAERHQLLEAFNATGRDYPAGETVHGLFEAAAARHPDRPALTFGEQTLSYGELEARSGAIARRLAALEVEPGTLVGVLLERGPDLIAALVGVLRAGAAYVPLDPTYPPARLNQMLQGSRAPVLIGRGERVGELAFQGTVLDPAHGGEAPPGPLPGVEAGELAYVIFTSGSTGLPKGVMIEHRGVVNFIHAMAEVLDFSADDRTLGLTTLSFDIFVLEVFLTLARGATLILADETQQRDPQALARLLERQRPTVVQMTPSRLQLLLSGRSAATVLEGVRALLVGGEAFPHPLLKPLQKVEGLRLFNVYGPTETTVWSSARELTRADTVTLGRPIANTRLYILSPDGELLPPGAVGELWIGGAGLARGYLDDPERTRAAFRPDPFQAGHKIYRTGDRAAWTAQGELVYHGRADDQVKLRGYRIELAEVESVLLTHPGVEAGAVVVREPVPGNPLLVAFYRAAGQAPSDAQLRDHLADRLPDYMVPGLFVALDDLPLTPNGKIDRRALPVELPEAKVPREDDRPEGGEPQPEAAGEDRQGELEDLILSIWRQVLGPRSMGASDSFFDVGGNSFSLVLVHGLLAEKHPGLVEVADLFAHPTPRALAHQLAGRLEGPEGDRPELVFPEEFFHQPGGQTALGVELDGQWTRRLTQAAGNRQVGVSTLALALGLLYLNKFLKAPVVTVAADLAGWGGPTAVTVDFATVRGLDDILAQMDRQRRPLAPPGPGRDSNNLTILFDDGGGRRPGFDLVLGLTARDEALLLRADHDGRRLNGEKLRQFLANYVRLIKAVMGQNVSQGAATRVVDPAA